MKTTVLLGITAIVIAIIIVVIVTQGNYAIEKTLETVSPETDIENNDISSELQAIQDSLEDKRKFDFETHDFVRFYRGSDNAGATIVDILNSRMYENYPDINQIVSNPHRVEWYNYVDEDKGENYVVVGYAFETFKEKSEYIWEVEKTTNTITAKNDAGQELLNIVNSEN